jgi:hypothetical protein
LRPSVAAFGIYIERQKENHIKTEGEPSVEDNLFVTAYVWLAPAVIILSLAFSLLARRRAKARQHPLQDRVGRTTLGRLVQPLPGDIDLIAQIGQRGTARKSAGMKTLRTTPGLRAISLGVSALGIFLLLAGVFALQGLTPDNTLAVCLFLAVLGISVLEVHSYELRYDRDGMVLTRLMYWRRSFDWVHLMGIDDDQNYHYVLAFSKGGRVKVMKHLVGMTDFLTHVATVLDRNDARHAGTARG